LCQKSLPRCHIGYNWQYKQQLQGDGLITYP
jgi:hypothetical protein